MDRSIAAAPKSRWGWRSGFVTGQSFQAHQARCSIGQLVGRANDLAGSTASRRLTFENRASVRHQVEEIYETPGLLLVCFAASQELEKPSPGGRMCSATSRQIEVQTGRIGCIRASGSAR